MPTIDNWRALREALDAGPTEGERFIQDAMPWTDAEGKFVQFEAFNISAGSADRSSDDYYRIATVSNINNAPCNKANAMLFAAAHPAAIRALLDERDRLAAQVASFTEAARDVLAERRRHVEVEGWTSERDDAYIDGAMALAAGSYCESAARPVLLARKPGAAFALPKLWPSSWATEWWKPRNPRADLIRAGALILAEIERLDRAAMKGKP